MNCPLSLKVMGEFLKYVPEEPEQGERKRFPRKVNPVHFATNGLTGFCRSFTHSWAGTAHNTEQILSVFQQFF